MDELPDRKAIGASYRKAIGASYTVRREPVQYGPVGKFVDGVLDLMPTVPPVARMLSGDEPVEMPPWLNDDRWTTT